MESYGEKVQTKGSSTSGRRISAAPFACVAAASALSWLLSACGSGVIGGEPQSDGSGTQNDAGAAISPLPPGAMPPSAGYDDSGLALPPAGDDAGTAPSAAGYDASRDSPPRSRDGGALLPGPEAGIGAEAGIGRDGGMYPAFPADFGQLVNHGETVLTAPVVVPITWNSDPSQAMFDQFVDGVGVTAYWKATTSEYGVGPLTGGMANHVHISTAGPATMGDSDFKNQVAQNAGAAWPAATDQSIYAFFLPPGTSLQIQGSDACSHGIGGYHDQVTVGSTLVAYAIVPSCSLGRGITPAQQSTAAMSHELLEAVTDPWPHLAKPGLIGFDADHFSFDWFQSFQSENGDACELYRSSFFKVMEPSFTYYVQRTWSNDAARQGHDPCVPAPSTPYFNVTPLNLTAVNIDTSSVRRGGSTMTPTKGVHIPVGQSGTIDVGFYSDGPTSAPWMLDTIEGGPLNPVRTPRLTVKIDKSTGSNGDRATATVTVMTVGPLKGELLVFRSTLGMDRHYMPVVISSE